MDDDATEARARGKFEGMVLERLDTAVEGIRDLKAAFGGLRGDVDDLKAWRRSVEQRGQVARGWWQRLIDPVATLIVGIVGVLVGRSMH